MKVHSRSLTSNRVWSYTAPGRPIV